jgi:hypothetical protein
MARSDRRADRRRGTFQVWRHCVQLKSYQGQQQYGVTYVGGSNMSVDEGAAALTDKSDQIVTLINEVVTLWPEPSPYNLTIIGCVLFDMPFPPTKEVLGVPVRVLEAGQRLRDLVPLVESDEVLAGLVGAYVVFENQVSEPLTSRALAFQLYRHALLHAPGRDPRVTLREFRQFVAGDSVVVPVILFIGGIRVDGCHSLGDGVELVSLRDFGTTGRRPAATPLIESLKHYVSMQGPGAVLVREITVPYKPLRQPPPQELRGERVLDYDALYRDEVQVTALADGVAFPICLYAATPPDVPFVSSLVHTFERGTYSPRDMTTAEIGTWRDRLASLKALDSAYKPRIRRALYRLHGAILERSRGKPADACIELRVALESCLTEKADGIAEITYRLSTRIARFLHDGSAERMTCQKRFKEVYGICSRAVHGGNEGASSEIDDALKDGIAFCREALKRMLAEQKIPLWNKFDLDGV